ncbi:MAG: hypothetical protein AAF805_00075 [Planctomycetota bacterium]
MSNPSYALARIASYTGQTPTLDGSLTFFFDDLRDPQAGFVTPERSVELVTRVGVPGHGVRLGPVMGPQKRLLGRRAFLTIADAMQFGVNLKQLKPRLGQATDHGTLLRLIGAEDFAYDVLSVVVRPPKLSANETRQVSGQPAVVEGFYEITAKRRVDGPADTNIL